MDRLSTRVIENEIGVPEIPMTMVITENNKNDEQCLVLLK